MQVLVRANSDVLASGGSAHGLSISPHAYAVGEVADKTVAQHRVQPHAGHLLARLALPPEEGLDACKGARSGMQVWQMARRRENVVEHVMPG